MQYAAPTTNRTRTLRERLLGLPLFYKVLIANTAIVVLGAVAGTTLTLHTAGETHALFELVALFTVIGTLLSVMVNWVVLRAALRPLLVLERAINEVRHGNFNVRVGKVAFSDPSMEALADTFNGMLDNVERYRAQMHDLSVRALTAQEDERKRISRELHDDTAQSLTAQLLRLKTIEAKATDSCVDPAILQELIEMTAQMLEDVRHMAHELRPPMLDDLGLIASLEGLLAQFQHRFGIPVTLRAERMRERLSPDIELAAYRIVQEALTNVAKHAEARHATVTLRNGGGQLRIQIEDDGRGFDPDCVDRRSGKGLGLFGMRERALLVGGTVVILSRPGCGTLVDVVIPVDYSVPRVTPEVLP